MKIQQDPVESLILPNNLELKIYDRSKKLAGDRWYVEVMMEIPVPLTPEILEKLTSDRSLAEQFAREKGNPFPYRHSKARHFIDEREKEKTFQELKEDFLKTNWAYLSNPRFALSAVAKAFKEWDERRRWRL
ncbi:MAG: hypothetical protein WHS86_06815 [Desulfosoma sp.]